jgi:hypothetical protein
MIPARVRVLYVTDLAYQARGRRYCDEDIQLTARLRERFDIALCHPLDAAALMGAFDVVVIRNSGPVIAYQDGYDDFRRAARAAGAKVFTELRGKADMAGKQYLLDLFAEGYPVIPTIESPDDLARLPVVDEYVVKPKLGADSVGLRFLPRAEVASLAWDGLLAQPRIDFAYEMSFYFIGRTFQYALSAPRPDKRWELRPYQPTGADLAFAQRFVDWNDVEHGIQRVDACRTADGGLLLVELEDLNPYLSLDLVDDATRNAFIAAMGDSIHALARTEVHQA